MSITINGYKPFLIQKMGSESNPVYDSNAQWGMLVKSFPFQALPEAKEPYKNDWKDENGDEEYVGELKFKAYTMSVEFAMVEDSTSSDAGNEIIGRKLKAFIDYIKDGQFKIYDTYTGIGRQKVRYAGYDDKGYMMMGNHARAIFTIKFKVNDPITNISKPVAIPAIGILHTNGTTYTKEEWSAGGYPASAAQGVSVFDLGRRILLHKGEGEDQWMSPDTIVIPSVITAESQSYAALDFGGKLNTDAVINAYLNGEISDASPAVWSRLKGEDFGMASGGQMYIISRNKDEVNACLTLIGGDLIAEDNWTSTQYNNNKAWCFGESWLRTLNKDTIKKFRVVRDLSDVSAMRIIGPSSIPTMNTDYQYSVSFNRTPSAITYMNVACHDSDITISDVTNSGFKLRFNHTYNVKAKDVTVIVYCEAEGQWFVEKRAISIAKVVGIGIQHKNKNIYTKAEWIAKGFYGAEAVGVVVTDGTHTICLNKAQGDYLEWSSTEVIVSGCKQTTFESEANADFAGAENTDAIIAAKTAGTIADCPAADWCRALGAEWYLPAGGEMLLIMTNKNFINECMTLIDGVLLPTAESQFNQTSTQYGEIHIWGSWCNQAKLVGMLAKQYIVYHVRAVSDLS